MNPLTGEYHEINEAHPLQDDEVLVQATEDGIAELSRRVRLGASELEHRKTRRKQQKTSRRANR